MKLLVFAGSRRRDSLNKKLARLAAEAARARGAEVDLADFREFELPVYDGDAEAERGLPPGAEALRARLAAADGLLLATPEYNHSVPGSLKNAIDWLSRAKPNPMKGRPALVLSASPGLAGGSRGAWALRVPLELNGMLVYPGMFSLPQAHEAFAEDGGFRDGKQGERLDRLVAEFLEYARRLTS